MDHKERMLANLPYKAWLNGLSEERLENKKKIFKYNNLEPGNPEEKDRLIKDILGKCGDYINIEPPFFCDYGYNIEIGANFFANHNTVILDGAKVKFGDNVWIGGNVTVCPGVTIGSNSVIGAGAVVTHDIPDNSLAFGVPAKVARKIENAPVER
jgi:acetyltransferase-like isoleucine patch superfamily enzyme